MVGNYISMGALNRTILTEMEKNSIYGLSWPGGNAQINAITHPKISTNLVYCDGDAYVYGSFLTRIKTRDGVTLPPGSRSKMSVTFDNDESTGIYYEDNRINFVNSGQTTAAFCTESFNVHGTITTSSGNNLVLLPSGPYIDCSGRELINVGGSLSPGPPQTTNPNRYVVVAPVSITTYDALPTNLYRISVPDDSASTLVTEVTCTCIDTNSSASFTFAANVKSVAGTVTLSPIMQMNAVRDSQLVGAECFYSTDGSNLYVTSKGLNLTTIKWFGATTVTCQLF